MNNHHVFSGIPGIPGDPGLQGLSGPTPPTGYLLVRHSQSTEVPSCPFGQTQLWDGYSLLYIEGNERSQHQDLGNGVVVVYVMVVEWWLMQGVLEEVVVAVT